jgi:D-alanyl-lipoteichoic acid acyltransferase DltB (MBOAT superfamily)
LFNTNPAIILVFISSALWHGISLNFLLWGILHATAFIYSKYLIRHKASKLVTVIQISSILIGRLLFSESDSEVLLEKLRFRYTGLGTLKEIVNLSNSTQLAIALGVVLITWEYNYFNYTKRRTRDYRALRSSFGLILITLITLLSIQQNSGTNYAAYGQR